MARVFSSTLAIFSSGRAVSVAWGARGHAHSVSCSGTGEKRREFASECKYSCVVRNMRTVSTVAARAPPNSLREVLQPTVWLTANPDARSALRSSAIHPSLERTT